MVLYESTFLTKLGILRDYVASSCYILGRRVLGGGFSGGYAIVGYDSLLAYRTIDKDR